MIEIIGTELYQWDTGRSVAVTNIDAQCVHFANQGDSKAVIIEIENGSAKIPDYLLQTGKQLCAYAVANGVTIEKKVFSVRKRERPENYIYEEDQRNYIYALVQSAEEATAEAMRVAEDLKTARDNGEFDGKPGADGYTPVRGVDYWTEADKDEIKDYVDEQIGTGGGGSAEGAVLYTTQDLTPEQKAQARENIGAANSAELGSAKDVYRVAFDYEYEDEETGEKSYEILLAAYDGHNADLLNKTLHIKTYAYGEMCYMVYVNYYDEWSGETYQEQIDGYFPINPDADIEQDQKSGLCEFDIVVPDMDDSEVYIAIPFYTNQYIEQPEISLEKGTVWEEIKNIDEKPSIIACHYGDDGWWRKWSDGFAEVCIHVEASEDEIMYYSDNELVFTGRLPFDFQNRRYVLSTMTGSNEDGSHMGGIVTVDDVYMGGEDGYTPEFHAWAQYGDFNYISGSLYITGYWCVL